MANPVEASGLEDVVFATTRLSDVDGERGRLVVAGQPIEDLAGEVPFAHVFFQLFFGRRPDANELERVERALGRARADAFAGIAKRASALAMTDPMDALRAATAQEEVRPGESAFDEAVRFAGAMAVHVAAWSRRGAELVAPDPGAAHAADYLRLVTGRSPEPRAAAALDAYLVTVAEHGMNASTFAARVVASTASDTASAVVAAIGALKGKLHGGAPGPVLDMLDAIGRAEAAEDWVLASLARKDRIMGMGHRVYRVRDPRAFVLERQVGRLEAGGATTGRLALARAVERAAETALAARHPDRPLKANVEFYTAILLEALGLRRELFTPTFAIARVAGWCAHVDEQRRTGKLVRPRARYVG